MGHLHLRVGIKIWELSLDVALAYAAVFANTAALVVELPRSAGLRDLIHLIAAVLGIPFTGAYGIERGDSASSTASLAA